MTFDEILTHRVSTRKYNDRMPDDAAIQKVIDAALLSPIVRWHKLHLSVVTSKEAMNLADEAAAEIFAAPNAPVKMPRPYLYSAPVWIILSGKKYVEAENPQAARMNENLFWNVGSIIENMELQATAIIGYSDADLPERKVKPELIPVSYIR